MCEFLTSWLPLVLTSHNCRKQTKCSCFRLCAIDTRTEMIKSGPSFSFIFCVTTRLTKALKTLNTHLRHRAKRLTPKWRQRNPTSSTRLLDMQTYVKQSLWRLFWETFQSYKLLQRHICEKIKQNRHLSKSFHILSIRRYLRYNRKLTRAPQAELSAPKTHSSLKWSTE